MQPSVPFDQIAGQIQAEAQKSKPKLGRPSKADVEARARSQQLAQASLAPPPPDFSIYGRAARPYIPLIGEIGVQKTGYEGWRVSAQEADAIANGIPPAMQELWPHMQSRYAACWALAGSVIMLAGAKTIGYLDWKKKQDGTPAESERDYQSRTFIEDSTSTPPEGKLYA